MATDEVSAEVAYSLSATRRQALRSHEPHGRLLSVGAAVLFAADLVLASSDAGPARNDGCRSHPGPAARHCFRLLQAVLRRRLACRQRALGAASGWPGRPRPRSLPARCSAPSRCWACGSRSSARRLATVPLLQKASALQEIRAQRRPEEERPVRVWIQACPPTRAAMSVWAMRARRTATRACAHVRRQWAIRRLLGRTPRRAGADGQMASRPNQPAPAHRSEPGCRSR